MGNDDENRGDIMTEKSALGDLVAVRCLACGAGHRVLRSYWAVTTRDERICGHCGHGRLVMVSDRVDNLIREGIRQESEWKRQVNRTGKVVDEQPPAKMSGSL